MASSTPMLPLLGLNELVSLNRWDLENRCRALLTAVHIGDRIALCRVLGRYKFYVGTDDVAFGVHMMMEGFWESWLTVFMARRIKPGMRVVDAGANLGYYTLMFADLAGSSGRVAAIEPNPKAAALLRRSVFANGFNATVEVTEAALTDVDGVELTFHSPAGLPMNARIVGAEYAQAEGTVTVAGTRLDTVLAQWPSVDFIKMDVEGAEEAAISGAWGVIERDRPELVLEFNVHRCADPEGLLRRLSGVYGDPREIDIHSDLQPVTEERLLDRARGDDWLLFYSVR